MSLEGWMKKRLILITVTLVVAFLLTGCKKVESNINPEKPINVCVSQEFVIAIGANPTTGYDWEVSFDEDMLVLVEKTYKLAEEVEDEIVGVGGVDYFHFKALKTGEAEITMVYKRSWEVECLDQKVFTVCVNQ
jgi:inhibitor of cysteine peptidase